MICEFHSLTWVCSYSVTLLRAVSQAWIMLGWAWLTRVGSQVGTYLVGDLGQLRDGDGLEMYVSGIVMEGAREFVLARSRYIGYIPTRECCPQQPLYSFSGMVFY
jgi:hypothetical protein